jgi:adenylosuccinate synthase
MPQRKTIDMIVDLQYGSTGKGLAASYLSEHRTYDMVVSANMPNAGHTAYDNAGRKFVHKVLPSGVFHNPRYVAIGPGAVFSPARLHQEIGDLLVAGHITKSTIVVHENAVPLTEQMVADEVASGAKTIASTLQGSMIAQVRKMERNAGDKIIARDAYRPPSGLNIQVVNNRDWLWMVMDANCILAEGAQGYSLGINQHFYPHVTSRDCTAARFLADMNLPVGKLRKVVGVARTYPIRVGNTEHGNSGGTYPYQSELSWDEVGQKPEVTTVTGRIRRVFSFSDEQLVEAIDANSVDDVFLNFVNYMPRDQEQSFVDHVARLCANTGSRLAYLGYGPHASDVVAL